MADAIKARDLPGYEEGQQAKLLRRERGNVRKIALSEKVFEGLTPPEKDLLLKALAIQAGLIDDSDDE